MTTAEEIRSAYVKLKDRWISGEELSGAWVDTPAYFEQKKIAGSSKMGLYLKYVWWLDVSANFLVYLPTPHIDFPTYPLQNFWMVFSQPKNGGLGIFDRASHTVATRQ